MTDQQLTALEKWITENEIPTDGPNLIGLGDVVAAYVATAAPRVPKNRDLNRMSRLKKVMNAFLMVDVSTRP